MFPMKRGWLVAASMVAVAIVGGCAAPVPVTPAAPPSAVAASSAPAPAAPAPATPAATLAPSSAPVPSVWDWSATDLVTGEEVNAATFAGTDVIIWFWAPWCPTCNAEAPDVVAAAARLPDGVRLVGLPGQSDAASSEDFIARHGVDGFPQLHDADGSLWTHFDVFAQPVFALVNDDGTSELVLRTLDEEGIVAAGEELAGR